MVSDNHAGDVPPSRAGAGRRPGRHGRRSGLRAAIDARLEELPFSRGVVLMVTTGLALAVLVIGTTVALTSGGSGSRDPRSAAAPPSSASPGTSGDSPRARASHRRPRTSSSTMVGSAPSRTASPDPSATPSGPPWWRDGHPHWRHTTPPPWWRHR